MMYCTHMCETNSHDVLHTHLGPRCLECAQLQTSGTKVCVYDTGGSATHVVDKACVRQPLMMYWTHDLALDVLRHQMS